MGKWAIGHRGPSSTSGWHPVQPNWPPLTQRSWSGPLNRLYSKSVHNRLFLTWTVCTVQFVTNCVSLLTFMTNGVYTNVKKETQFVTSTEPVISHLNRLWTMVRSEKMSTVGTKIQKMRIRTQVFLSELNICQNINKQRLLEATVTSILWFF